MARWFMVILAALLIGAVFCIPASAATTQSFSSLAYDGTLTGVDDNYTKARESPESVTVEYTTTGLRVGQESGYEIYRAILFFDTSALPQGAVVESAYVALRGMESHSGSLTVAVVSLGDVDSPLSASDYESIGGSVLGSAAYEPVMRINLPPTAIIHEGVTVVALRSQSDIDAIEPAAADYVVIGSSESSNPPQLVITWSRPLVLGEPTTLSISSGAVYSGYREPGDQLWVARAHVEYAFGAEDLDSREYWTLGIISDNVVLASTPLWSWGYVPVSIYLSARHALPPGQYSLRLMGNEGRYVVPPGAVYALTTADYKGADMEGLDRWIMSTAVDMGRERGDINYYRSPVSYFDPEKAAYPTRVNDAGQALFVGGIPLIDAVRPDLFVNPVIEGNRDTHGTSYADSLWGNWGANLMSDWALIARIAGLPGQMAASIAFMGLVFAVVYVVASQTGRALLGLIPGVGGIILGSLLGAPNIVVLVSVLALATVYIVYELVPTRT